jgi:hypothetical protein
MTIPQVKNPIIGALIIFVGLPLLYYGHAFYEGEIHAWTDITLDSINHRTFTSFWAAVFWVFFRSPWAATITSLTTAASTIDESGAKVETKKSIVIEQSPGAVEAEQAKKD